MRPQQHFETYNYLHWILFTPEKASVSPDGRVFSLPSHHDKDQKTQLKILLQDLTENPMGGEQMFVLVR